MALSGLTENANPFSPGKSDSFATPSLRGPAQSLAALLGGPDQHLARGFCAEDPAELLTSRAKVPDKPTEPLRPPKETPKTADMKPAKVTKRS